jgi:hypothetical protein
MSELYIDLFEKYLQNQLSSAEKSAFETQIQKDADFRNEFENFKTLTAGIRANALQEKLRVLKAHAAISTHESSKPSKHPSWRSYIIYGVLLSSLIGMVIYFSVDNTNEYKQNTIEPTNDTGQQQKEQPVLKSDTSIKNKFIPAPQKVSPEKNKIIQNKTQKEMYAQTEAKNYYKEALTVYTAPTNFAIVLRDSETSKEKKYADALGMYENKKYLAAAKILTGLEDEKSTYLRAHCHLLSGRAKDAAAIFRNMADNDFSSYYQEARWYLAIALLADYPQTKTELEQVIKSLESDPKQQKSLEILKSIVR